ncbi:MAG: hypothetical protein KZQ95_08755 [Candidatus Thiodiazotropha sp. (ex Epidulcina cf. delphinae)]|nr:hypothetical protein [Candidatus Thiodiazotropha sp. (ex Epidulcina cf. delphinae)]
MLKRVGVNPCFQGLRRGVLNPDGVLLAPVRQGYTLIGIDLLTIAAYFHFFPILFNRLGSGHALHAVVRIADLFHHEGHDEHEGGIERIA